MHPTSGVVHNSPKQWVFGIQASPNLQGTGYLQGGVQNVSSAMECLLSNPKVPSSITSASLVLWCWIMVNFIVCIPLLEWSTTFHKLRVYSVIIIHERKKNHRTLFEER